MQAINIECNFQKRIYKIVIHLMAWWSEYTLRIREDSSDATGYVLKLNKLTIIHHPHRYPHSRPTSFKKQYQFNIEFLILSNPQYIFQPNRFDCWFQSNSNNNNLFDTRGQIVLKLLLYGVHIRAQTDNQFNRITKPQMKKISGYRKVIVWGFKN